MSTLSETILPVFFGPGNVLRWDEYQSEMAPETREQLEPWVKRVEEEKFPFLLPRVHEGPQHQIEWYAIAKDARQARKLKEELWAFIGPTYTDFTGAQAQLDLADSIDATIESSFSPHVFRLRVADPDDKEKVRSLLNLMCSLWEREIDRRIQPPKPIGRLIRDFEMALQVRHELNAKNCLDEICGRGRLNSRNIAFLRVIFYARFEKWEDLLARPECLSLISLRRPLRVTEALIQAIYKRDLAEFEERDDATGAIDWFDENQSNFGSLLRHLGSLRDPEVLKAFMVKAVASKSPDATLSDSILARFPKEREDYAWIESLVGISTGRSSDPVTKSLREQAEEAYHCGDWNLALKLFSECEVDRDVIRNVISCAHEIDNLESARKALTLIEESPSQVTEKALSMRMYQQMFVEIEGKLLSDEVERLPENIPDGWVSWLQQLNQHGSGKNAVENARRGAAEWSLDQLRQNPDEVKQIADLLLGDRTAEATELLRNVVPNLLGFFLPDDDAVREFKPVYLSLAFVLALDESIGRDDLTALASLWEASLECGLVGESTGTNEYSDVLETAEMAWKCVASSYHLDWVLGVLDLFIEFNVQSRVPIGRFLDLVLNSVRDWPTRRVRIDQWDLLTQLCEDLGGKELLEGLRPIDDESESTEEVSFADRIKGKSIAIYTLTERIGRRVEQVIKGRCPDVKIHLCFDKVGSDRLRDLAKNADVFLVNTWDAKHAATGVIKKNRDNNQVTLEPQSKSPSSLLRKLYQHFSDEVLVT